MKHSKHSKKRTGRKAPGMLRGLIKAVVLLTLVAVLAFIAVRYLPKLLADDGLKYEDNVVVGTVGDPAEQIAKMDEMLDKGMLTMSINASPVWKLSDREAGVNWQIENPAGQANKLIRVEIYRDDTEQLIYETGAIPPGSYVTGTKPKRDLSAGKYSCTAYFYGYDIETQEFLGQVGAQILLQVLN